jgi:hypothetical protein
MEEAVLQLRGGELSDKKLGLLRLLAFLQTGILIWCVEAFQEILYHIKIRSVG